MTGLSNFKRVQNIIRERATNNKILTIISLTFASYYYLHHICIQILIIL